ncbi:MAG: DUF3131 domain-containing protein [Novosphingobium sp.]|uniref:DUF3131 domain-containing protein n=1 Tax=Novosphingobium sp. TaxID=1874826 RepID=UPI003B9C972F
MKHRATVRLLTGLAITALLGGCGVVARSLVKETTGYVSPGPSDEARGKAAWAYFRSTRSGATGVVEAIAGAGFTTPSAIGDQIAAAIAADRLHLIDRREFDDSISSALTFLSTMPLSNGEMPARFYSTRDGGLIDPPRSGVDPGWSSVETGRLLVWLRVLVDRYPQYEPFVVRALSRWKTCRAVDEGGHLRSALPSGQGLLNAAEAESGAALYAAQGFLAWGESVALPSSPAQEDRVNIEGEDFSLSDRSPVQTAPYALLGIEFGWKTPQGRELAPARAMEERLWQVQTRRWKRSNLVTARGDYRRTSAPYAVTDAVLAGGFTWSTTGEDGRSHPELALVSTRTGFLLTALHGDGQAPQLMSTLSTLYDPGAGWYEGRYESSGAYEWTRSSATNAVVLETILFKNAGTLFSSRRAIKAAIEGDCLLPALAAE